MPDLEAPKKSRWNGLRCTLASYSPSSKMAGQSVAQSECDSIDDAQPAVRQLGRQPFYMQKTGNRQGTKHDKTLVNWLAKAEGEA